MNLKEAISADRSKHHIAKIVEYIGDDPAKFKEIMAVFLNDETPLRMRAGWVASDCAKLHPELPLPYLSKLVDILPMKDIRHGAKRNITRLLQFVEVPSRIRGKVYSHCLDRVGDAVEEVAVRCFAMTAAAKIAANEPLLMAELKLVASEALPHTTAAFHARYRNTFGTIEA